MELKFVDAQSFDENFEKLFLNCTQLDVAVAYITQGGLEAVLQQLKMNKFFEKNLPIRIVFGLSSTLGITEKNAAVRLFELATKHKNIKVKKLNNPHFHPKLMIFHGDPTRILLGSSNLTVAAQTENCEANVIVENPSTIFIKDVTDFFEKCLDDAITLEQTHIETYNERRFLHHKKSSNKGLEDKMPSFVKHLRPMGKRNLGKPVKSKSYYDQKIRELANNPLTNAQKRSLSALRANRTRYYPEEKIMKQKIGILLPVTHGAERLEIMKKDGRGKWTIGISVTRGDSILGQKAYFYLNSAKTVSVVGIIDRFEIKNGETIFIIKKIKSIKNRKLNSFKKLDGTPVEFAGSLVYILD